MAGGFKRSGLFGLVGVFVVAAIVAGIALTTGGDEANPKMTLALIFGVIAVFCAILFALQRSDRERVAGASVRGTQRAAAEGGGAIENPATMTEPDLWAAMAVKPIDRDAVKARSQMWDSSRSSQRLAMLVTLLIFLTVPSIYLLESFVPLLIGGPLIAICAVYGSVRALAPGGDLDEGYRRVGQAMAPLGLEVTERPSVSVEMRDPVTPRIGAKIRGALVLKGERHGRPVSMRLGSTETTNTSEVEVGAGTVEFKARSRDGRVRAVKGEELPPRVEQMLKSVPSSTRWKKVEVEGGPGGIVVRRKSGEQADWLCDLWLAEQLAAC